MTESLHIDPVAAGAAVHRSRLGNLGSPAFGAPASERQAGAGAGWTRGTFQADRSVSMRTPMHPILGSGRPAQEGVFPATDLDGLERAHHVAAQLTDLLDEGLALPRVEPGRLRLARVPFDLEEALQRTADLFGGSIQHKGLEFVLDLAPDLPPRLIGDVLRLSQVLSILVGNAMRFTRQGHVRVAVRELPVADPRSCMLRFSVLDSGLGIDPARCSTLFDGPAQTDRASGRRAGGRGPGLAICDRLVDMMGGRIGVESTPGRGSDFWFTARLQRTDMAAGDTPAAADVAGLHVLLVHGGSATGRVIEAQLRAWQVDVARSGDALGAARQIERMQGIHASFDLVLLDWQASDVDGLRELMQQHAKKDAATRMPLMALLTDCSRDAQNRALGCAQVDALLVKPVLASPLLTVLRQACARRASADRLAAPPAASSAR